MKDKIFGELVELCRERGLLISTAESCTGGMIASGLVSVPGASDILEMAYVTYSDRAKNEVLGVPSEQLCEYSAVSAEVARSMVKGARMKSSADIAISTTGYAGPDGDEVGLVYIGVSYKSKTKIYRFRFLGDRKTIRESAAQMAVRLAIREICGE